MPYDFLNASLPIQKSPKQTLVDDFQNNLDVEFKVSSDWFSIMEETPFGSKLYENIDVRINDTVEAKQGINIADDFKKILFQNNSHAPKIGGMYYFDSNYWIVTNLSSIKSLSSSCIVRRCNNVLRWKNISNGKVFIQPCVIDYLVKETRDYSTAGSSLVTPSGFIEVTTQFNSDSNLIKSNQRFLFGNPENWNGFKIMGGGLNNFNSLQTMDNMSVGIIKLSMLVGQVGYDTDDIVNGIADSLEYGYTIHIPSNSITISLGSTYDLISEVKLNGETTTNPVTYSSTNNLIATVNSNGIITPIAVGNCVIRCSITGNSSVYEDCLISVTSSSVDNYLVTLVPDVNYIYENDEITFSVFLYKNNIVQSDTFVFTQGMTTVPSSYYTYSVIDGNHFKIKNIKRFLTDTVNVSCVSGSHTKNISFVLKGAW